MSKKFMSKDNIQVIISIFTTYMEDNHKVNVELTDVKKAIFSFMNTVSELTPAGAKSIHQMNLEVLTMAKAHYMKTQRSNKPNVLSLSREQQVFGDRKVAVNELIPKGNPYQRRQPLEDEQISPLDKIVEEREAPFKKVIPDITQLGRQINETAETSDDFMKRLKTLEDLRCQQERNLVDNEFRETNKIEDADPKALYDLQQLLPPPPVEEDVFKGRQEFLLPEIVNSVTSSSSSNNNKIVIQKYLSINSMDREWDKTVQRYNYSVAFNGPINGFMGNYKNVRSIEVSKVIIPEEIIEHKSVHNYAHKTSFNHEFSFSYPYVILRIDEFNDVYDGTNDDIRKSFCKLVYSKSYKAPNGRGYVILEPFQKEKKYFYPTPLANLSRFTISILKPNGFLLNESADQYKIFKIYYKPYNPHYYEVVTDIFYDKNEFFVGDVIKFKGFDITNTVNTMPAKHVTDFINRAEGHEIMQIGDANQNGFYRSFMIMALGSFDRQEGKYDTDMEAVDDLTTYNDTIDYTTFTGSNGYILNTSLQNTIGMSLDVLVNDVSGVF